MANAVMGMNHRQPQVLERQGEPGEPEIAEMACGEEDEEEPVSALSVEFLVTIESPILLHAQFRRHPRALSGMPRMRCEQIAPGSLVYVSEVW